MSLLVLLVGLFCLFLGALLTAGRRWSAPMPSEQRRPGFRTGAQERFERTMVGEAFISTLVVLILLMAIVWSIPDSAIRRAAFPVVQSAGRAAGLYQQWHMFSPNPYRELQTVDVVVLTADGVERDWHFPHGNALNQFSWYHWHKLKEQTVSNETVQRDVARWAARRLTRPGDYPVRVSIVMRTDSFPPPGSKVASVVGHQTLYTETIAAP